MGKYFGTDGYRGEAGEVLTAFDAYKIGRLLGSEKNGKRVRAVIGKDTRRSSYMLEYALAAGLASSGADAYMLHVTTTPSVSYAVAGDGFDLGIMISASHNPYCDNGIKIVKSGGEKMDDCQIEALERRMDMSDEEWRALPYAKGADIGRITDYSEGRNRYVGYLISVSRRSFKGLRIGLDCGNGGAWMIAKSVFDALGARVYAIGAEPNGLNINSGCGSTHVDSLCALVREKELDMGFAFDGDADRCIAVDERGEVVDGDRIMYILAKEMKRAGELKGNTVVTTVMSNMGLWRALENEGIGYEVTSVGDRYVHEKMTEKGYSLGGEQSGHVILGKYATTGDGILTAIKITEAVVENKTDLSHLGAGMSEMPQVVRSVRAVDKDGVVNSPRVQAAKKRAEERLGKGGRVMLRKSGTEPVIRIMVEAESREECEALAQMIERAVEDENEGAV